MSLTLDLFSAIKPVGENKSHVQKIDLPNATLVYTPALFDQKSSDAYFQGLLDCIDWEQEEITLYGKTYNVPRLSAWHGDFGKSYTYSGVYAKAKPWVEPLLQIKERVEMQHDAQFNSVLVNLYRDGRDSVAWHSDDEPELGNTPVIASVSLGEVRTFQMRLCDKPANKYSLQLEHGSCLLMSGETQAKWQHRIPKEPAVLNPRINLTFRMVK